MRVWLVIASAALLILGSCAQIVSPTGGPKDSQPPKVKAERPANGSVHFTAKGFEIAFDEFIQLDNPVGKVIISPPLRKNPSYTLKRKSLFVKWDESLAPDATYIFNFGEAIKDNNEGNVLNNYTYVLSTGAVLDSMELKGKLVDALTGDPVEGAMLMLYRDHADSLPRTTLPDYFGRTGKDGHFHITNIPDLPFKAFALKDQNSNFRFDVPDEMIGFIDTLLRPVHTVRPKATDTIAAPDTTAAVPMDRKEAKGMKGSGGGGQFLTLRMFTEQDTTQFLKKASNEQHGKYMFVYNRPVGRFRALLPAGRVPQGRQWAIREFSAQRDTVILWTTELAPDTLDLILMADQRTDTVQLINRPRPAKGTSAKPSARGARGRAKTASFELKVTTEPPSGRAPLPGKPLVLQFSHPVTDIDLSRIELREDSIPVYFELLSNDTALRRFGVDHPWRTGRNYNLQLMDSAATDIFGLRNDTVTVSFKAIDNGQLGDITLQVSNIKGHKVLELLNASKQVVDRKTVSANGPVLYPQLMPGKYALVMVDDLNANGRWDSGRYARRIQPEPVIILKSDIEVRANWQSELQWDASGSDIK